VKLESSPSDTNAMLSEAYGGGYEKFKCFLVAQMIQRAHTWKSQMKTLLITFFNIKGIVHC